MMLDHTRVTIGTATYELCAPSSIDARSPPRSRKAAVVLAPSCSTTHAPACAEHRSACPARRGSGSDEWRALTLATASTSSRVACMLSERRSRGALLSQGMAIERTATVFQFNISELDRQTVGE